ncbi:MAG: hypothetical protein ACLGJA_25485, partial [Gammaproteobacteria bacterium]
QLLGSMELSPVSETFVTWVTLATTWSIASDAPAAHGVNGKSLVEATIICGGDAIGSENTTSVYGRLLQIDSGAFNQ